MILKLPALLVLTPLFCCAAESCPWINAGTVGGILGGAVAAKMTQTTCEFTHRGGGSHSSLRVEVKTGQFQKYLSQCKSKPRQLTAIGNEAVTCSAGSAALAIGRVRDHAFIIRVTAKEHASGEKLAAKAQAAAEHVAGNLF
jgi:hypothetical protein